MNIPNQIGLVSARDLIVWRVICIVGMLSHLAIFWTPGQWSLSGPLVFENLYHPPLVRVIPYFFNFFSSYKILYSITNLAAYWVATYLLVTRILARFRYVWIVPLILFLPPFGVYSNGGGADRPTPLSLLFLGSVLSVLSTQRGSWHYRLPALIALLLSAGLRHETALSVAPMLTILFFGRLSLVRMCVVLGLTLAAQTLVNFVAVGQTSSSLHKNYLRIYDIAGISLRAPRNYFDLLGQRPSEGGRASRWGLFTKIEMDETTWPAADFKLAPLRERVVWQNRILRSKFAELGNAQPPVGGGPYLRDLAFAYFNTFAEVISAGPMLPIGSDLESNSEMVITNQKFSCWLDRFWSKEKWTPIDLSTTPVCRFRWFTGHFREDVRGFELMWRQGFEWHHPLIEIQRFYSIFDGSDIVFGLTGFPQTPDEEVLLLQAWRAAVISEPYSFLCHRFEVWKSLLGFSGQVWAVEAPTIKSKRTPPATWYNQAIAGLSGVSPFYRVGIVWILALGLLIIRIRSEGLGVGWTLFLSGSLPPLAFFFVGPSAEYRYVVWSSLAFVLAILSFLSPPEGSKR